MIILKLYALAVIAKIKTSFFFSLLISPVVFIIEYFNKSFLTDKAFFVIIVGAITVDLIVGIWRHLKMKTFNHKKMLFGLIEKVFVSTFATFLFGAFYFIIIDGAGPITASYFLLVTRLVILNYIALPTFRNFSVITDGKLPPSSWFYRMEKFESSMIVSDLIELEKLQNEKNEK